ncbi:1-acyl-sn-glycerol-3-phosphate acyltransferase BAT2, chloroplastic isoform X2 [Rhododendron vialii]|uniref:1-acyl-sn-glycerol-3-phosphate acyltransferase BAT2, chloroplastic isoform X2 n=1 Tax=Rhododendron vialii TaxID=182163 RepID=UPI00265E1288|nr:1-acyl-sn-glycerol-3-phosphate acyltransferase BAT2, chloroplastic isoform X2 [Rhododendron vialii]
MCTHRRTYPCKDKALTMQQRSYNGLYMGSSPSSHATSGKALHCGPHNILFKPRNYAIATCCSLNPNKGCYSLYSDSESRNRKKLLRYIAVRSELAGTGTSGASYPLSGRHVVPKVRGICFYAVTAVVAIFLFVLMLVAHPFVLLLDRYRRQAHYFIARIWALATVTPLLNVDIKGFENLPAPDTPAVYVSNHQSFLDIYALLAIGRSFKFISKTSIFVFPIIGWAMILMGVIPLRRMDPRSQLECLKRCTDFLKKGASVFFFPEGTRSKDGKLGAFKKGAFSTAAKTEVPVVPITIIGTGKIMPAGRERILNLGSVRVIIHKPIEGSDPEILRNQARNIIADGLVHQG